MWDAAPVREEYEVFKVQFSIYAVDPYVQIVYTAMDAIFSIPMFSFLLIPAFSSYGTSLNLLFFYILWTTLVLSNPPLRVELVGVAAVRLIFFLIPSVLFFLFDILLPSAAKVIKSRGVDGLPGGRKQKIGRREFKVAAWSIFNVLLGIALQGVLEYTLTKVYLTKSALKVSTTLPMPWGIVKDLFKALLSREILQYVIHRYILHSSSSPLAGYHNSWYHSLSTPYPLTAHYDHPLAYLLFRFTPTFIPAALFRFHLLTYLLFLIIISLEETFAYSGYKQVPTGFLIGRVAHRVELHLTSKGPGNFAEMGILDWVLGSSVQDNKDDDEYSEDLDVEDVNKIAQQILDQRKGKKKTTRGKKGT